MKLRKQKWALFVGFLTLLFVVSACSTGQQPNDSQKQPAANDVSDLNWKVPDFTYTDQNGKPFGLNDLKGKVWLTDFMFTRCPDICPPMTANLSKIQQHLKDEGIEAEIVSFSVDPEHDTPEVLKKFSSNFKVDESHWHFITGYPLPEIQAMVKDTFKGNVQHQKGPSEDVPLLVNHPSQFYLIDGEGKVVRFYDGLQPDPKQIANDIKEVQK
ncbi:SCO family protein [Hazenella coriacea]|uniref:Protein SCO1/2 n=1 Tax=Hazenella coriacea TaxID=1179467 RepID=A0A4R3LBE2_9BACL|nr:SCO family protein [Hazenella coriacea]TCS96515.1 protein SCO1/2 [Hazenella coriacea]